MSIVYKDIDTYTPKSSIAGTEKIPVSSSEYITPNQITADLTRGNGKLFYGTCGTAAATADKVVTCPSFTSADLDNGAMILVKFDNTNSASVSSVTLNVNSTGAYDIKQIRNGSVTTPNTAGDIRNTTNLFILGKSTTTTYWYLVGPETNTIYSSMTQDEINAGTGTTGRRITPQLLRGNFYTESEVDAFFTNRPTIVHLADESEMPATPDANTIYMIDA